MKKSFIILLILLWVPRKDNPPSATAASPVRLVEAVDYHSEKQKYWNNFKEVAQELNEQNARQYSN